MYVLQIQSLREQQIHSKEQYLAMQSAQDRAEFERVLAAQKEIIRAEEEKQKHEKVNLVPQ